MIYEHFKEGLLRLLRAPRTPPEPPAGSRGSIEVFRASPRFLTYRLVVWGAGFALGLLFEVILGVMIAWDYHNRAEWGGVWVVALLVFLTLAGAAVKYLLIRLDYDMRYYVVTDRSLRIRQGALVIQEATYTFANVQNLKITQGPIERLLGISNLVVETAGGAGKRPRDDRRTNPFTAGHEGVLRGISNARQVRDRILDLLKHYRDAGLGDPEERRREGRAPVRGGLAPLALERLREIRDELRATAAG